MKNNDNIMLSELDDIMYEADGNKSAEQQHSEIIEKRLNLLINFLGADQEVESTFGDYLENKNISLEEFLEKLPEDYQFKDIDKVSLSDQDAVDSLLEYMGDLNTLNAEQYEKYDERMEEAEEESMDGEEEYYEAKGKRKAKRAARKEEQKAAGGLKGKAAREAKKAERKKAKEDRKKAREEKKRIKKQLKEDVKSGKISKKDKHKAMKGARKDFRKKAGGSFVGRAGRKFRKFDPGMALMRNSYNSLLRLNFANQAYNLGRIMDAGGARWEKVEKIWKNFGGEVFSLKNNIKLARNKKPILGKKKHGADGEEEFYNVAVPAVGVAAWVTLATTALSTIGVVIKEMKKEKGESDVEGEDNLDLPKDETTPDDVKNETEDILKGKEKPEGDDDDDEDGEGFFAKNKMILLIGGGVAAALALTLIITMAMKKKK